MRKSQSGYLHIDFGGVVNSDLSTHQTTARWREAELWSSCKWTVLPPDYITKKAMMLVPFFLCFHCIDNVVIGENVLFEVPRSKWAPKWRAYDMENSSQNRKHHRVISFLVYPSLCVTFTPLSVQWEMPLFDLDNGLVLPILHTEDALSHSDV